MPQLLLQGAHLSRLGRRQQDCSARGKVRALRCEQSVLLDDDRRCSEGRSRGCEVGDFVCLASWWVGSITTVPCTSQNSTRD